MPEANWAPFPALVGKGGVGFKKGFARLFNLTNKGFLVVSLLGMTIRFYVNSNS